MSAVQYSDVEAETLQQLLILEKEFRDHDVLMATELAAQKEIINRLKVLSERYTHLNTSNPCSRYPGIDAEPVIEAILKEFSNKLDDLSTSNWRIMESLRNIRKSKLKFDELCSQLDMTIGSPFIIGDSFHKPIAYFIELVSDLFKYFHAWALKLDLVARRIDTHTTERFEEYKKLIEPSEEFKEYLQLGLTYCRYLRPKVVC